MGEIITDSYALFISISNGDEQAFGKLFFAYKDMVYSIALVFTENKADAEEIVQEVFSRVWKHREKLPEINEFTAWIKTVTRNRCLSDLKKKAVEMQRKKEISYYLSLETENTGQGVEAKELQALIHEAMAQLSTQQRKIFELSRLQGMDRNTIARMLDISPATVSVHLTIALRTVRNFLRQHRHNIFTFICLLLYFSPR